MNAEDPKKSIGSGSDRMQQQSTQGSSQEDTRRDYDPPQVRRVSQENEPRS